MFKRKLLSLLLAVLLIAGSVSVVFPMLFVKASDNLFENGDFATYSGNVPNGWTVPEGKSYVPSIVADTADEVPDATNIVKFTRDESGTGDAMIYNNQTISIEKNTKYTFSFWVKDKNVRGLRFYLYEPEYTAKGGAPASNATPSEGQNIYTYSHDSGTTRVIRTDVVHTISVSGGNKISQNGDSMVHVKSGSIQKILTPDFPNETNADKWVKVVHTFTTGNDDAHKADVRYAILVKDIADLGKIEGGEFSVAGFKATAEKLAVVPNTTFKKLTFEEYDAGDNLELYPQGTTPNPFEGSWRYPNAGEFGGNYNGGYYGHARAGSTFYEAAAAKAEGTFTPVTAFRNDGHFEVTVKANGDGGNTGKYLHVQNKGASGISMGLGILAKNTEYTLKFKVYKASENHGDVAVYGSLNGYALHNTANLGHSGSNKLAYVKLGAANGTWQEKEVSFNSGDNETAYLYFLGPESEVYVDDFELVKKVTTPTDAPLDTLDFEDKTVGASVELYPQGTTPDPFGNGTWRYPLAGEWAGQYNGGYYGYKRGGSTFYALGGEQKDGTFTPNTTLRNDGHFSMIVTKNGDGGNTGKYINVKNKDAAGVSMGLGLLEKNTNYTLTFKVYKASGSYPGGKIYASLNGESLHASSSIVGSTADLATFGLGNSDGTWQLKTVEFSTGKNETAYLFFAGNMDFFVDDFKLVKEGAAPIGPLTTLDFEDNSAGDDLNLYPVGTTPNPFEGSDWRYPVGGEWSVHYSAGYYGKPRPGSSYWTVTGEKADGDFTPDSQFRNSNDIFSMKVEANELYYNTGKYAHIKKTDGAGIAMGLGGLEKNTQYTLSFNAYSESAKIGNAVILSTLNVEAPHDPSSAIYKSENDGKVILAKTDFGSGNGSWQVKTITFNTGDHTTAYIMWVDKEIDFYADNFKLDKGEGTPITPPGPPKVEVSVNDDNLGSASLTPGDAVNGDEVTFTATPLKGNGFDGWYVDGHKVSSDLEYKTTLDTSKMPVAHFIKGALSPDNASVEDSSNGRIAWFENGELKVTDDNYIMDTHEKWSWQELKVTDQFAHTGTKSLHFSTRYSYGGRHFTGLEKNTKYTVSFWAYMDGSISNTVTAYVLDKAVDPIDHDPGVNPAEVKGTNHMNTRAIAYSSSYNANNQWVEVITTFTTGDFTEITLWISYSGNDSRELYIDDFAIYKSVEVKVSALPGGAVKSDKIGLIPVGEKVTAVATPFEGNTFVGWSKNGEIISTDLTYTFTANEYVELYAVFDGWNLPAKDVFSEQGMDGTFEKGTITGWYATYESDGSGTWMSWTRSEDMAYEGQYSLRAYSRVRNQILPIKDLKRNTSYMFEFYYNLTADDSAAHILPFGIIGKDDNMKAAAASKIYAIHNSKMNGTTNGWQRGRLYFTTGDDTEVNFSFRYETDNTANVFYFDNMSLTEYTPNEAIVNGNMDDGRAYWLGDAVAAEDAGNKVIKLESGKSVYQTIKLDADSSYTLKYRAKGNVFATLSDINATVSSYKRALSSVAAKKTSGEWNEYEITFYSGINLGANITFTSLEGEVFIDDVRLVKNTKIDDSYVELYDFETDRFEIKQSDSRVYSIYTANGPDDDFVYDGSRSLKISADKDAATASIFNETWFENQVNLGSTYRYTIYYKMTKGALAGNMMIMPEESGTLGAYLGFEHSAADSGWNKLEFLFVNTSISTIRHYISTILGSTDGDIYIDNISLSIAPPMVSETNSTIRYCENLYNEIKNGGFEEPLTAADWKNLPSNAKVIKNKSEALKGSHFLRVTKGETIIIPLTVDASKDYYFGASVKGTAGTKGSVALANSIDPIKYYADMDGVPASIISVDPTSDGYQREAFKFGSNAAGKAYLIIQCTAGTMDIDSLMLFKPEFGYRYDPNDYTVYKPYDYEATKSSTVLINGGYGAQPYYVESNGANPDSPDTGDTTAIPVAVILVTAMLGFGLVVLRRKEGAKEYEK